MKPMSGRLHRAPEPEPMSVLVEQPATAYISQSRWDVERPRILVACCSDGRLQEAIDEFLQNHLHVRDYDRFYAPGGPEEATCAHYRRVLPGCRGGTWRTCGCTWTVCDSRCGCGRFGPRSWRIGGCSLS